MRPLLLAPVLAAATLLAAAAAADVGPPPTCGAGTHHEYLFGHHCVPDGSHLERDPAGPGVKTVSDNAAAIPVAPTESSASTDFASPPPSASAPPVPATPPAGRGCACGIAEKSEGAVGLVVGVAALAALMRRRRGR